MERSPESGWGVPSPEGDASSSSESSSKEGKSKKGSEAPRAEGQERQERQSPPPEVAKLFGREVLKPTVNEEVVVPLRGLASLEGRPNEQKEKAETPAADASASQEAERPSVEQEREIAAEVVDQAQARNEQEVTQAKGAVEQASAENVGQLLDNMETGLENAPPEETAEQIIDRTTEETAAVLRDGEQPDGEMMPLDWPRYQAEAHDAAAGSSETDATRSFPETADTSSWQPEQFDRRVIDDDPDSTSAAAPYVAPGFGQGSGGGRQPGGYTAGFNPNAMPPFGAGVPAAANLGGSPGRNQESSDGLIRGFLTGLVGGGIIGHWLGKRGERAKAARAMAKQDRLHQEQVARYESQVAESQARIRTLTERQAYAASQAVRAAETASSAKTEAGTPFAQTRTFERPVAAAAATEAEPAVHASNAPKQVEMMTDSEVHEASKYVEVDGKTLHQLKEEGAVTAQEEREILRIAESGNMNEIAHRTHFMQEAHRVLMRHELDPALAHQQTPEENKPEPPASEGLQPESLPAEQSTGWQSGLVPPSSAAASSNTQSMSSQHAHQSAGTSRQNPHPLIVANIVAIAILLGLLVVLLIVSISH